MSKAYLTRPRFASAKRTFAIVASKYNPRFVQGLVDHASREIYVLAPNAQIQLYQVPGAFEIPLVVQELLARGGIDAIVALGVIIQGETAHAGHIATAVTDSLMALTLKYRIPVIHEVLSVNNEEQAEKRCLGEEINRGREAARVAINMVNALADLRSNRT